MTKRIAYFKKKVEKDAISKLTSNRKLRIHKLMVWSASFWVELQILSYAKTRMGKQSKKTQRLSSKGMASFFCMHLLDFKLFLSKLRCHSFKRYFGFTQWKQIIFVIIFESKTECLMSVIL